MGCTVSTQVGAPTQPRAAGGRGHGDRVIFKNGKLRDARNASVSFATNTSSGDADAEIQHYEIGAPTFNNKHNTSDAGGTPGLVLVKRGDPDGLRFEGVGEILIMIWIWI